MSNYIDVVSDPDTGEYVQAAFLDDFYGRHKYAVLFADGRIYKPELIPKKQGSLSYADFPVKEAYANRKKFVVGRGKIFGDKHCVNDLDGNTIACYDTQREAILAVGMLNKST